MELNLIVLTSAIISGLLLFSFYLGYSVRDKKVSDDAIKINKDNADGVRSIMEWMNFTGKKG